MQEEAILKQIENPNRESRASNETGSQHTYYDFMKPVQVNNKNNNLQRSLLYERDDDNNFDREQEQEMYGNENNPNFAQTTFADGLKEQEEQELQL